MSVEPEKLDPVLALLKAKQAPEPPAAFFDQLSHRIREGIQHAPPHPHTWWHRVTTDIDFKACLAGILVCALMLAGLLYALKLDARRQPPYPFPIVIEEKPDVILPPSVLVVPSPHVFRPADGQENSPAGTPPILLPTPTNSAIDNLAPSTIITPLNDGGKKPKP